MSTGLRNVTFVALLAILAVSCRRDKPRTSPEAVEKCQAGIRDAIQMKSDDQAVRTYLRECAFVFAEPPCRRAFVAAADLPNEDQRREMIFTACQKSYCPLFADAELAACQPGFVPSAQNLFSAWPPLEGAILKYDAKGYAGKLTWSMLTLYARLIAPKPAPSGSAATADGGQAHTAPGEARASAAPPVAGSGPAPSASAKP